MTSSEWDGTAWEGRATVAQKAATGPGVGFFSTAYPMSSVDRTPQALMRRAQLAYHVNPWIGTAESVVTRKVVGLPWHLENGDDEEYSDSAGGDGVVSPPDVRAARLLIERPQFLLPANGRKPATGTRRLMWSITSRHLGLCGMAYWFADGMDQRGIPTAWLYINPARMWPAEDDNGNLTGWVLDAKDQSGRGGTPLELGEVLPFYLDPPDWGNLGTGIYERAVLKAEITNRADQHSAYVLGTGGRIAGIVSPKDGTIPDEAFKALVNEFRNVNEAPDAAKRTTIMQGPTDFTPTAADPSRLDLVQLTKMNRDDIFTIWGVPPSQGPVPTATGLNSGETKGYDEAILLQGAVHDRVVAMKETLQYGWLDKYLPTVIELEIEEPEFDDDTPAYDRLAKANGVALTNAERRDIIGLPPTGDAAIDDAILLPALVTTWATVGQPMPEPTPPPVAPAAIPGTPIPTEPPVAAPGKAQSDFLGLRRSVDQRTIPAIKRSVSDVLAAQKRDVIAWIRAHAAHLASKPKDTAWWNDDRENKRMEAALRPHVAGVTATVTARTREVLDRPAKADPFEDRVAAFVWSRTGERIRANINPTTKQLIIDAVTEGFNDGLSPGEIADILETSNVFDAVRAELIARTETMLAYNDSALQGFTEFGVDTVEPLDGDQDEECIARLARGPVSIDVALDDIDHPNGTLDWVPYFGKAAATIAPEPPSAIPPLSAAAAPDLSELMAVLANRPEPVMVQVTSSTVTRTVIDRDLDTGRIIGFHEEPLNVA